jgi:hypothetical protein
MRPSVQMQRTIPTIIDHIGMIGISDRTREPRLARQHAPERPHGRHSTMTGRALEDDGGDKQRH